MGGVLILYLNIDYMRGVLFDNKGEQLVTAEEPIDVIINEEYVEQDPEKWIEAIVLIVKKIREKVPEYCIESISVIYQPGTFVCIDRSGSHIMNAVLPCDRRARHQAEVCEKVFKKHSDGLGVPWDYMAYPKLMWIKYNKPDIYKRIFKVLTPDGYISYRLCGETAIDCYSAAFFGYNIKDGLYNSKMLDNLEAEISVFPDIAKIGQCIAILSGHVKYDLGLKEDTKFVMLTNCLLPLAMRNNTEIKDNISYDAESSNISFIGDHVRIKRHSGIIKMAFKDDKWLYGFMGDYEALFLKWMQKLKMTCKVDDADYVPGCSGLVVLPHIIGNGFSENKDARGGIIGINNKTSIFDMVTAYYESVGFSLKRKVDRISGCGIEVKSIEVLSNIRDELFYKIISNITSKKIIINDRDNNMLSSAFYVLNCKTPEEGTVKREINPDDEAVLKYKQLQSLYSNAYDALDSVFRYRRKISKKISSYY